MSSIRDYNPKLVTAAYLGQNLTGFAEGTFINVTPSTDYASRSVGAQGEAAYSISPDRSCTIEMTFLQNSDSNAFLTSLLTAFEEGDGSLPEGSLVIQDGTSNTVPVFRNVKILQRPSKSYSDVQQSRTWSFFAEYYTEVPNNVASANTISAVLSGIAAYEEAQRVLEALGL